MQPITPIVPGLDLPVTVFAKDQPQYKQLPTFVSKTEDGLVLSRWKLSVAERLRILFTGNLWIAVLTFNAKLQPFKLLTKKGKL